MIRALYRAHLHRLPPSGRGLGTRAAGSGRRSFACGAAREPSGPGRVDSSLGGLRGRSR